MENTPTPYQRQRRASRLYQQDAQTGQPAVPSPAAEPPAPACAAPVQPCAAAPAQPVQPRVPDYPQQPAQAFYQPATQQRSQAAPVQQTAYGAAKVQAPYQQTPQTAYPQPRPVYPQQTVSPHPPLTPAHPLPQSSGNRPPRTLQQRQAASSGWSMPEQAAAHVERESTPQRAYHAAPAGDRPHAAVHGRMGTPVDEPVSRSTRPKANLRSDVPPAGTAPMKPVAKRKTPSWLLTLLSLMLIGVMALVAFEFLMQAYLKTAADERQAAYEDILFNYHVTEQEDGTLRVTWQDLIEKYAEQYNLEPAFVTAVIRNESSFRTNAESSVGARGLMQMMPDTAEWIAGKLNDQYDFDRLYEAETSIRYGCWYLNYLSELFRGDTVLVCAAYHAGQGEVWGWLGDPAISPDGVTVPIGNIPISNTKTYAGRVTQAYGIYQTLLYPETVPADGGAAAAVQRTSADR